MPVKWKAELPDIKVCPVCKQDTGRYGFKIRYYRKGRIRVHGECVEIFDQTR